MAKEQKGNVNNTILTSIQLILDFIRMQNLSNRDIRLCFRRNNVILKDTPLKDALLDTLVI